MLFSPNQQELLEFRKAIAIAPGELMDQCPNCGGRGTVYVFEVKGGPYKSTNGSKGSKFIELPPDYPKGWYSGALVPADCPVCNGNRKREWLQEQCNLHGSELYLKMEDFVTYGEMAGKIDAKQTIIRMLAMNQKPAGFVTLVGEYGVGKTMLLKTAVNSFRAIGVHARYQRMADILADIREKWGDDHAAKAVEETIAEYLRFDVLAIDEIDRINLTGWTKETAFRLLDGRYDQQFNKLTLMASNTPPEQMPADLGYLSSRMSGGEIVIVAGPDMRPVVSQN